MLHHGRYEAAKSLLQNMALERGYFDGQWLKHEVLIDKDTQKAQVNLQYDSGERYKLGEVSFKHTRANQQLAIDADLLDNLVPFKAGDDYEAEKVIKLNKVLLDSRYFNEVKVRAESGLAQDYVVPVNVLLAMDSPNQVDLGAGYATDIGARVSATWRRSLLNRRGHSIETSSEISQVRQSATARYGIPWTHPINDTLQILAGFKREDIDEIAITNNSVLGVERQKNVTVVGKLPSHCVGVENHTVKKMVKKAVVICYYRVIVLVACAPKAVKLTLSVAIDNLTKLSWLHRVCCQMPTSLPCKQTGVG